MDPDDLTCQEVRQRALDLLARREHGEIELREKLRQKMRTTDAVLDSVLEKLKDDGHQSDERYTEAFVRSRVNRGDGPVKIRHALAQNGILPDTIDRYLDQGENFWCALLTEVRDRKFGGRAPSDYSEWARQARFLQSRGFTSEQIRNSVAIQESE